MKDRKDEMFGFPDGITDAVRETKEKVLNFFSRDRSSADAEINEKKQAGRAQKLIDQNREYLDYLLDANVLHAVRSSKIRLIKQGVLKLKDQEIRRTYYQKGGIRYYGLQLGEYISSNSIQEHSAEEMWISAYNSLILYMIEASEQLQEKCKQIEQAAAGDPFSMKKDVLKSIGYEDFRQEEIYFGYGRYKYDERESVQIHLRHLERITEANRIAFEQAKVYADPSEDHEKDFGYEAQYDGLLRAIIRTCSRDAAEHLSAPAKMTAGEYRKALLSYFNTLQNELLEPFRLEKRSGLG